MIKIDTFLEIGMSHKVCEDYIISGYDPFPHIILADGCSSSDNTDMGARILCYLARQYLKYRDEHPVDRDKMGSWIIHNAELTSRQLGLKISCLDATLIVAYELDGFVYIYMYGDGCVALRTDHQMLLYKIDYTKNAPYYLSYTIDDHRNELYKNMKVQKTVYELTAEGDVESASMDYDTPCFYTYYSSNDIMIASDGLLSFIKKLSASKTEPVPALDVLNKIFNFKTTRGEFLKRRCNKQMKEFSNEDITHFDDLSIGVFLRDES